MVKTTLRQIAFLYNCLYDNVDDVTELLGDGPYNRPMSVNHLGGWDGWPARDCNSLPRLVG